MIFFGANFFKGKKFASAGIYAFCMFTFRQARMPSWWEFVMAVLNDKLMDDHWRPMVDLCSVKYIGLQ